MLSAPAQQSPETRPVGRKEAALGAAKVAAVLSRRHGANLPAPAWPSSGDLKRTEALALLSAWHEALQPRLRLHVRGIRLDLDQLRKGLPEPVAKKAEGLVRAGFLAPVGPLVTGPSEGLTPIEFGDALGFFTARLERQTAEADPEYTPGMMWPF
jgi:hypothetical protein